MKQSSFGACGITEDETEVSQILLDLENLACLERSASRLTWALKRKRSSMGASMCSVSSSPSLQADDPQTSALHLKPNAATSPSTPLSFSPSGESDEKPKKKFKNKAREEYTEMIDVLTQRRDLLMGEIEIVKKYYNELKARNSKLQAIKQEVINNYRRKEKTQMEIRVEVNLGMASTMTPHQLPLSLDPTGMRTQQITREMQYSFGPIEPLYSSNNRLGAVNHVGPCRIPDLNISAEDNFGAGTFQPLDMNRVIVDRRARSAEARRIRSQIVKIKMKGAYKGR